MMKSYTEYVVNPVDDNLPDYLQLLTCEQTIEQLQDTLTKNPKNREFWEEKLTTRNSNFDRFFAYKEQFDTQGGGNYVIDLALDQPDKKHWKMKKLIVGIQNNVFYLLGGATDYHKDVRCAYNDSPQSLKLEYEYIVGGSECEESNDKLFLYPSCKSIGFGNLPKEVFEFMIAVFLIAYPHKKVVLDERREMIQKPSE